MERYTQRTGDARHVDKGHVAFAALDAAHVIPVDFGTGGQFFLGDAKGRAMFSHHIAEGNSGIMRGSFFHRTEIMAMHIIGLHIMSVICLADGDGRFAAGPSPNTPSI